MSITRFRCERDVLRPLADVAHYKWSAVVYTLTGDTLILSSPMGDELGRMTVGGELDGRFEINDWRMLNALEDMPHNAVEVEVVRGSLTEVIAITDRDRKRVWRWQLRGTVRGGEQWARRSSGLVVTMARRERRGTLWSGARRCRPGAITALRPRHLSSL